MATWQGVTRWVYTTGDGHLWFTLRNTDGSWQRPGDVTGLFPTLGPVAAVAGVSGGSGDSQWILATAGNGHLWHALRTQAGPWLGLVDVGSKVPGIPGPVATVGGADGWSRDTQWIFATIDGHLWHTIRHSDGSWSGLGDVEAWITIPGPVTAVTGAAGTAGDTQFVFTTGDGHLWHVGRYRSNGSWSALGDLGNVLKIALPVTAVAGADGANGETQWIFTTDDGHLWHTVRTQPGPWTGVTDLQQKLAIPGPVTAATGASGTAGSTQWMFTTGDGHLWHAERDKGGKWSALGDVGGVLKVTVPVAAVAGAGGALTDPPGMPERGRREES